MIEVTRLSKRFGDRPIFENVDLSVPAGQCYALLGRSGGGKSVFLRTLVGLLVPDSGQVKFGSQKVAFMFQQNALFTSMTVLENLMFPVRELSKGKAQSSSEDKATQADTKAALKYSAAESRERSMRLLDRVGLGHCADLLPGQLSGGMQKRLGIARALITDPEILLCDEPTAGLDPITSRSIADLLKTLTLDRAVTTIVITAEIPRAYQLAHQICFLNHSHLQVIGTPNEATSREIATKYPDFGRFVLGQSDPVSRAGGPR